MSRKLFETGYKKYLILFNNRDMVGYTDDIEKATSTDLSMDDLRGKYKYIRRFHPTIQEI